MTAVFILSLVFMDTSYPLETLFNIWNSEKVFCCYWINTWIRVKSLFNISHFTRLSAKLVSAVSFNIFKFYHTQDCCLFYSCIAKCSLSVRDYILNCLHTTHKQRKKYRNKCHLGVLSGRFIHIWEYLGCTAWLHPFPRDKTF